MDRSNVMGGVRLGHGEDLWGGLQVDFYDSLMIYA